MTETPRYRVLQDSFYEPDLVRAGSIIETSAPPGPHVEPLNRAAWERLEAWYEEEFDEIDNTGKKTGNKIKPHAQYRLRPYVEAQSYTTDLIEAPGADDDTKTLSVAEVALQKPTSQRPPPARKRRADVYVPPAEGETAKVLSAAAPPPVGVSGGGPRRVTP